jgi:hypothetical protein
MFGDVAVRTPLDAQNSVAALASVSLCRQQCRRGGGFSRTDTIRRNCRPVTLSSTAAGRDSPTGSPDQEADHTGPRHQPDHGRSYNSLKRGVSSRGLTPAGIALNGGCLAITLVSSNYAIARAELANDLGSPAAPKEMRRALRTKTIKGYAASPPARERITQAPS